MTPKAFNKLIEAESLRFWLDPDGKRHKVGNYGTNAKSHEDWLADLMQREGKPDSAYARWARVVVTSQRIYAGSRLTDNLTSRQIAELERWGIDRECEVIDNSVPARRRTIYAPPGGEVVVESAGIVVQYYSEDEDYDDAEDGNYYPVGKAAHEVFVQCNIRASRYNELRLVAVDHRTNQVVGAVYDHCSQETWQADGKDPEDYLEYTFDIAILPAYQGGTLGYRMMMEILKYAKSCGDGDLPVLCKNWVINPVAGKLLELLGFECTGEDREHGDSQHSSHWEKWI